MPKILHILSAEVDSTTERIIAIEKTDPRNEVEVIDLRDGHPDYTKVIEAVFQADSIAVH